MSQYEDLAVEGGMIEAKPEEERWCDIIAPAPEYHNVPAIDDPTKEVRKLIMNVMITGKNRAKYYPNVKSGKFISGAIGTEMKDWVGKRIFWKVIEQNVFGAMKQVLFIEKIEDTPIDEKVTAEKNDEL